MKTLLAAALMTLLTIGCPASVATEAGEGAGTPSTESSQDEPAPAQGSTIGTDVPGGEAKDEAKDQPPKNFTRHRPGACPEGPPCKVED